jgi:integrase
MARRAWGSGSLSRRKSDGRWVGRVSDGRGGHRYVTGTDEKVVKRRLRELARSTTSRPSRTKVGDYLDRWLREAIRPYRKPRTHQSYASIVTEHLTAIGGIELGRLTPLDVQTLINDVLAKRSSQTARNVLTVIRSALSQAVRWQLVPTNVAKLVQQPRVTHKAQRPYDATEAARLIDGSRDDPYHAVYVLAVTMGMRQGEILALQEADIAGDTITVQATMRRVSATVWSRDVPKTPRSRRTLTMPAVARQALERHVRYSAVFIFTRPNGMPYVATEVTKHFQRLCTKLGLRRVTFHSLRHTAAALMLDGSAGDLRMVQSALGHSTIATTVDIYGGLAEESRKRAAGIMDDVFGEGTG